jgi:hypothetical protein
MPTKKLPPPPPRRKPPASRRIDAAAPALVPEGARAVSTHLPEGAPAMSRILLIDLAERELQARAALKARADSLQTIDNTKESSGGLSADQIKELAALRAKLDSDVSVDEFYRNVAAQVARKTWDELANGQDPLYVLKYGLFGSQQITPPRDELGVHELEIAFVCGLLELDNRTDPAHQRFVRNIAEAQGEYRQSVELFKAAYGLFKQRSVVSVQSQIDTGSLNASVIGCINPDESIANRLTATDRQVPGGADKLFALSARTLAQIVRRLVADRVTANDTWLTSRLEGAFNLLTGSTEGAPPSALEIDLPDLEEDVDIEIVKENLNAVQAIYFSYQLEEMRMYQVVERIVELFRQGLLPLSRGRVGDYLYKYYQKAAERITESERRDLYFRCFGAPGGNPNGGEPNRDFNELWLRFVSAVSSFARQLTVDRLLRTNVPMSVSQEQVRKAGRDLGANLSRNGFGIAYFAATEMQRSILEFRDVLTDPDLRNVFGARDMWQVIEIVNANYLGGAKNTHRFRTQSRAGAIVIRWIANHVQRLSNMSGPVLMVDQIVNPQLRSMNADHKATVDPSDWDLVQACEQWLAVGGVQDASVEQYSQPIESPIGGSRPIGGMPQMARDALESAGISLPA